ncbi:GNAT family N-acetyltransferase [Streptomyces sp. SID13031]|uniref:GNAT family N-acetyltransferase n=1 Tax=Streptomyces sp. SID13031 TaxID=2706046 RepID=UPI0013C83E46|nr:GNAT family N-acetyltransferase [Streptomyces sp. SID13031]NEA36629.1 GNAT family N-acetyltransferase [Streptomyces sp. SID13031]
MSDLGISAASTADLQTMRHWASDEGWDPGRSDMLAFGATDPSGFLIGRLDGEPIACCSGVRYGSGYGFLGFYIARPEVRGQGYGIQLWHAVMEHLAGRTVGLDGVVDQQDNYRKSGFQRVLNHIRYAGVPATQASTGIELVDARSVPFRQLADYDRRFFPAERDAFLSLWVNLPDHRSLAAIKDGKLAGFGVLRPTDSGARIGPLYASSDEIASAVLAGLTKPGEEVAIDVPDINAPAVKLAERFGLSPTFECARMYAGGPPPEVDQAGIFATTTLELG